MRARHRLLSVVGLLVSLGLVGCQTQPEVMQSAPPAAMSVAFKPVYIGADNVEPPSQVELLFGITPSVLNNKPRFQPSFDSAYLTVTFGAQERLNLDELALAAQLTAKPLIPVAPAIGLQISPATAKVSTIVPVWRSSEGEGPIGLAEFFVEDDVSGDLRNVFLLYTNEPVALSGISSIGGTKLHFDVAAKAAGFFWVQVEPKGEQQYDVVNMVKDLPRLVGVFLPSPEEPTANGEADAI